MLGWNEKIFPIVQEFDNYVGAGSTLTLVNTLDVEEREVRTSIGLEYFLAREAVLFTRYEHTDFSSDQPASDYVDDEIRVLAR